MCFVWKVTKWFVFVIQIQSVQPGTQQTNNIDNQLDATITAY